MKSTVIGIVVWCCSVIYLYGQQRPMWSSAHLDWYLINPAAAGFKKTLVAQGIFRNQWNGISDGTLTQGLGCHLPLYIARGAAGAKFRRDVSGPVERFDFSGSYNYVQGTPLGLLSGGLEVGWTQLTLDGSVLRTPDGVYSSTIDHQDDRLPISSSSGGMLRWTIGAFIANTNWKVGAGWKRGGAQSLVTLDGGYEYKLVDIWFFHGEFSLAWRELDWTFFTMLYQGNGQTQWQNGLRLSFPSNIEVMTAFRGYTKTSQDALIFGFGFRLNPRFNLHYAFDYLISGLNQVNSNNTHEFTLGYSLNKPIRTGLPPRIIYNPRF